MSLHVSGQFADDSTLNIECSECGMYVLALVRFDDEAVQKWAFDCPECGEENRPDLTEDDPDRWRDD